MADHASWTSDHDAHPAAPARQTRCRRLPFPRSSASSALHPRRSPSTRTVATPLLLRVPRSQSVRAPRVCPPMMSHSLRLRQSLHRRHC